MQGSLEALQFLLKQGHQPQRSFFLAFGHDEEVSLWYGEEMIWMIPHARQFESQKRLKISLFEPGELDLASSIIVSAVAWSNSHV